MIIKKSEQVVLSFSFITLIGHALGMFIDLYTLIPQYDVLIHFFGGAWIASVIIYLIEKRASFSLSFVSVFFGIMSVSGIVLIIALGWEFIEFILNKIIYIYYEIDLNLQPSIFDTLKDLVVGFLGAVTLAWGMIGRKK